MKAIVVEDEGHIRRGIIKMINWNKFGITDVLEADNGVDAYEIIISERPDIILLDICMPKMSGIELLELIREDNINLKVIVLSGHDEFEYAQKAMRHGVEHYLLKPSPPEKIEEILGDICKELSFDADKERNYRELVESNKRAMPFFRAGFVYSLISGDISNQEEVRSLGDYLGVNLYKKYCMAVVFSLDEEAASRDPERSMLQKLEITKAVEEAAGNNAYLLDYFLPMKVVFVLFCDDMDSPKWKCFDVVREVHNKLPKNLRNNVYIGIGSVSEGVSGISASFKEAVQALDNRFFDEKRHIYYIEDMVFDGLISNSYPYELEKSFIESVRLCEKESANNHLSAIVNALKCGKSLKAARLAKIHLKQLAYQMVKIVIELEGDIKDLFGTEDIVEKLDQLESINECKRFLGQVAEELIDYIGKKRYLRYEAVIRKVISFVETNYSDEDLNLEKIAKHVSIHPNYLSQFFKKHKGESLSSFICRFRIQKAVDLLILHDNKKVYDIAIEVGFSDAHYFTICFKNQKGVTPSEFRQRVIL